jgi:hypothetical protein
MTLFFKIADCQSFESGSDWSRIVLACLDPDPHPYWAHLAETNAKHLPRFV